MFPFFPLQLFKDAISAAYQYKKNPTDFTDQIMEELEMDWWIQLSIEIDRSCKHNHAIYTVCDKEYLHMPF